MNTIEQLSNFGSRAKFSITIWQKKHDVIFLYCKKNGQYNL